MKVKLGQRFVMEGNQELVSKLDLPYKKNPVELLNGLSGKPIIHRHTNQVCKVSQNSENGAFYVDNGGIGCSDGWDAHDIIVDELNTYFDKLNVEWE